MEMPAPEATSLVEEPLEEEENANLVLEISSPVEEALEKPDIGESAP